MDPVLHPELYEGIIFRRVAAYIIDVVIVSSLVLAFMVASLILGIATFGLTFTVTGLVFLLIPFAYHSVFIGGPRHATIGMGVMKLEVRSWRGGHPEFPQALLMTLLFYGSIALTAWLIVAIAIFSNARRCLHDYLSGTVVVNKIAKIQDREYPTSEISSTDLTLRPQTDPTISPDKHEA